MDVASLSPHGAASLSSYFDVSPNGFAWRAPRPEQITDRRAELDDKLIFDILLTSGGITDPDFLYPPRDVEGLERLLNAIQSSSYDTLKKHTLIYFLLKWHQDGREDKFKVQFSIPPQFSALADAYWYLDAGVSIPKAVSILSDARLNRDYTSKIIQAITLAPQPGPLILKYVRTTKPPLVEPPDMLRYLVALAESSVLEAWQYQRTFSESDEMRPRLFKKMLDWAISPNIRAVALKDLISLPLSKFEQDLLNDYASQPPTEYSPSAIAAIQDLVCVRYIELGKYIDAIKLNRKLAGAGFDSKDSSDRRIMIRELYESLSPIEKSLIDFEFKPKRRDKPQADTILVPLAKDISMSQSWEEVPVPENFNKSTSTPLRKIQIPLNVPAPSVPQFTVPTSTTPSVSGPTGPPPLLPISSTPSASVNGFTPRKSLPLSTHPAAALGKGRSSLSGVGQRIVLGGSPGVSSPASGMRFPVGSSKPPNHASAVPAQPKFVSTVNQANAFYQPKAAQRRQRLEEEKVTEEISTPEDKDDETIEVDNARPYETEAVAGWKDINIGNELSQSIFGGGEMSEPPHLISEVRVRPRATPFAKSAGRHKPKQKQPPGAFADDEEAQEQDHDEPEPEPEPVTTRRRFPVSRAARTSQAHVQVKEIPAIPSTKPLRRTRQVGEKDFGRSIPGSLMDEEEDQLAPLREPTPPLPITASKRPVRKARSTASVGGSEAGSDGEGLPSRRRSSRLSTTGSVPNVSPESKVRKSGRVSTAKRKK